MENALNLNTYEIRKYSFPFIYLFVCFRWDTLYFTT